MERGLFSSRETARTAIMDGAILVNGEKHTKAGMPVSATAKIDLIESYARNKFASRGGLKLESALEKFMILPAGRVCLDIGASTGGFTDCLLQSGAVKVYAIDVGYGQLLWHLRQDPRVVCLERFNARNLSPESLYKDDSEWADLSVVDVSFIALSKVLAPCFNSMKSESCEAICLIKPQFEIGRTKVGKGGVVRSKEDHINVIAEVIEQAAGLQLKAQALTYSPIKGPAGNIEFLIHLKREPREQKKKTAPAESVDIEAVVSLAHEELNKPKQE